MSNLSTAMMAALSGLRASQAGLNLVANNVANAGTPDYTRKTLQNRENVVGDNAVGVEAGDVTRVLDKLIQRQMWTESAGGSYTATKSDYHSRLDSLFGTPGDANALDGILNSFTQSLQTLATSPDNSTAQTEVLNKAQVLAQQLNGMSADIQSMRSQTEMALQSGVADANDALSNIARVSAQIEKSSGSGTASPALLDERDSYVSKLAGLMDIKVMPSDGNKISIFTTSGALLFDGEPAKLSFDSRGELGPQSLYSTDPSARGVGTITLTSPNGSTTDMIGSKLIRSGELGALVELRDDVLVEAQTQLDTVAANMSLALSNKTVAGTAATSGAQTGFSVDLAGTQLGNPLTISYTAGGVSKQAVFVEVAAGTALPLPKSAAGGATNVQVVGYTGGAAGAAAAINATLGAGFTASAAGSVVTVLDDGAAGTTDVNQMSASITSTVTSGNGVELPLFVDAGRGTLYTGSFDGGSQRTGYAARIALNKSVLANPSLLVKYDATTLSGDSARPSFLRDALTKTAMTAPPDTGIGGTANPYQGSVASFARSVVEAQGRNAETAKNLDSGQQIVVNALNDKFQQSSGVNVDTEMSHLLELQNAYAANARVMSTIKDMIQTLINM
jgi:flagellar hook-associated protein 1